jgi:Tfp pilus assembly protein PilF
MGGSSLVDETGGLPSQPAPRLTEPAALAVAKGEAFLASKQYQAAFEKFSHALEKEPDNHQASLGLAEAQLGLRQFMEALSAFELAMQSESLQPKALQGRGITLVMMGRDELAEPLLRQAVALDSSLWRAWNAMGRIYALKGETTRALASYDRALMANPRAAAVYNNRGLALVSAKRYGEAEQSFRKALAAEPDLSVARMNLRLAIAWQGRYDEAIAELKRSNAPRVLNNIGFVAMERGDYSTAKLFFTRAMEISPSYYPTAARNLEQLENIRKMAQTPEAMS